MKIHRTLILMLLIAVLAFMLPHYFQSSSGTSPAPTVMREQATTLQPLMDIPLPVEASIFSETPRKIKSSVVIEVPPQQPVETIEQRGDAMLFEIDALQGTPFNTAVVMPFN
jgi:hypothetical protein